MKNKGLEGEKSLSFPLILLIFVLQYCTFVRAMETDMKAKGDMQKKIRLLLSCALIFALTFALSTPVQGQDTWVHLNSAPTAVACIATKTSGDIYAGTNQGGVYHSTNHGNTWSLLYSTFADTLEINDIVFDNNGNLFAMGIGSEWGWGLVYIFVSTDNGLSWIKTHTDDNRLYLDGPSPEALGVNTNGDIFTATRWNLLHTTDAGNTWIGSIGFNAVAGCFVTNANTAEMYAGCNDALGGLFHSTNNGVDWFLDQNLGAQYLSSIAICPNGYVFACSFYLSPGFYRTTNDGESWQQIGFANSISNVTCNSQGIVLAEASNEMIYYSSDNGDTWNACKEGGHIIGADSAGYVYVSRGSAGLFRVIFSTTTIKTPTVTPSSLSLAQNYPNPFSSSTTFRFQIPQSGVTTLKIYNMLGECVATLASGEYAPGVYTVQWDAKNMPSGVYYSRLQSGGDVRTQTIILSE
jgi:photosystem II stability/assembly factor-like uncharacterized protein